MPRILLLGATEETVETLSGLGIAFTGGTHGDRVSNGAPPPSDWDLVLHLQCESPSRQQRDAGVLEVNDDYLSECPAPEIWFGWGRDHYDIHRARVPGYKRFEAQPGSERFQHVTDIFEEHEQRLSTSIYLRLGEPVSRDFDEVLAENQYNFPIAAIFHGSSPVLALIPPHGREHEATIVRHLLTRTLPKLFPNAYWDINVPENVRKLQNERSRVIEERRQRVKEIDAQIEEELQYYAPFSVLPRLRDDALKNTLVKTFQEFGFKVTDIDEAKESKDSDLMIEADELKGYIEAKSSGNRNCSIRHIEDFDRNLGKSRAHHGEEGLRLMVFNGQVDIPEANRAPTFSRDIEEEAKVRKMGLTTGRDLFAALEGLRDGRLTAEEIRSRLRDTGIISFESN